MKVQRRDGDAECRCVHCCHAGDCIPEVLRCDKRVGVESLVVLRRKVVFDLLGDMADCADERYRFVLKPAISCQ